MKPTLALAATVAATLTGLPAQAGPIGQAPLTALVRGDLPSDCVQSRRFGRRGCGRGRFGYGRGWRGGYGDRRGPGIGAAVGASVAGLATGAIIGGAIANSQAQAAPVVVQDGADLEAVAAGARRFRSDDAASGTYLCNDGARHACP